MRPEVMIPFYESLMRTVQDYESGIDDHDCETEDFKRCERCERSWDARTRLGNQLDLILVLLKRYHDALAELSLNVIQEIPPPRAEPLQKALMKALKAMDPIK